MSASLISLALAAVVAAGAVGQERKREPIDSEAWVACGGAISPTYDLSVHSSGQVFIGTDGVAVLEMRETYQTATFAAKAFDRRVAEGTVESAGSASSGAEGERRAVVRLAGDSIPLTYAPGFVERRVALYWTEATTLHAVEGPDLEHVLACARETNRATPPSAEK